MTKPNVIFTFCAGYGLDKLEPFISSWKRAVPSADLYFFYTNLSQEVIISLTGLGVSFVDIEPYWPTKYNTMIFRFFLYRDFLKKRLNDFEHVLLTDVRDVIFQSDPFENFSADLVEFASEDKSIKSDLRWNAQWIIELFGRDVYETIADQTASCAGTTLGPAKLMLAYLEDMCAMMETHNYDTKVNYDQGFHNYLVHARKPQYGEIDYEFRYFGTLGTISVDRIKVNDNEILLDGKLVPIIHQWDRHGMLMDWLASSPTLRYQTPD